MRTSCNRSRQAVEGVIIDCETELEYDVVEFKWKLRSFNKLRDIAVEKGLPPEGDVITSPMFIDSKGACWWLRVYPYQSRSGYEGSVSVFLHTDRPTLTSSDNLDGTESSGDLYFSLNLMALDKHDECIKETLCGTKLHKFKGRESANYGFYDFIDSQDVLNKVLCLAPEELGTGQSSQPDLVYQDKLIEGGSKSVAGGDHAVLNLYCQVVVYSSVITKLNRVGRRPSLPYQRLSLIA